MKKMSFFFAFKNNVFIIKNDRISVITLKRVMSRGIISSELEKNFF